MFRLLKFSMVLIVAAGLLFLAHGIVLRKAGEFLIKKDEMKPADAIVILAGEETERVEYGVRLFKEGWARKDLIIMAGGPLVWKYSWSGLMKDHARALNVPEDSILTEEKSRTTEEDALYTGEILRKRGIRSIILVTSPYHSRRAALIFQRVVGKNCRIFSSPAEDSWFHTEGWWKRRRDRAAVLNEYAKFLWLWIFGVETTV